MVVAQVVRIRNNTLRTFRITSGDWFYTPRIAGQPWKDSVLTVTPGFDQACEGLIVPWETLTAAGLEVVEECDGGTTGEEVLRLIVGPVETEGDYHDWLQYRHGDWEFVAQERWMPLGQRHFLGSVGNAVDLQMTFRDARGQAGAGPTALADLVHFDHAARVAPPNMVFLNVFDLAPTMSIPNAMLCNTVFTSFGAFHAAVEVFGDEWSFYRTPNPNSCGVCRSLRPRHHPVHVYRQSVPLGQTTLAEWEVRYLIRGYLALKWPGGSYDLLERNCIHFCDELLLELGVSAVPSWVRALHETGSTVFRWPLTLIPWRNSGAEALEDGTDVEPGDFVQAETNSIAASGTTASALPSELQRHRGSLRSFDVKAQSGLLAPPDEMPRPSVVAS